MKLKRKHLQAKARCIPEQTNNDEGSAEDLQIRQTKTNAARRHFRDSHWGFAFGPARKLRIRVRRHRRSLLELLRKCCKLQVTPGQKLQPQKTNQEEPKG